MVSLVCEHHLYEGAIDGFLTLITKQFRVAVLRIVLATCSLIPLVDPTLGGRRGQGNISPMKEEGLFPTRSLDLIERASFCRSISLFFSYVF